MDPESLNLVTEEMPYPTGDDYDKLAVYDLPNDYYDTEEGAMAQCRQWFDFNNYEGTYCCQMMRTKTTYTDSTVGEEDTFRYSMSVLGPYSSTSDTKQGMISVEFED